MLTNHHWKWASAGLLEMGAFVSWTYLEIIVEVLSGQSLRPKNQGMLKILIALKI